MRPPVPARATYADNQQLTHYLLGLLSDDDTERIDEAAVVDDDVAARLRVVERDVVDAYVRGRLPATLIGQFEAHLSSPRRREQVACAARFLRAVDRAAGAEPEAGVPTVAPDYEPQPLAQPAALLEHNRASRKRRALRLVAAVFVLAACGTLLFESLRSRPRADAAPSPIATSGQPSHEAAQAPAARAPLWEARCRAASV